MATFKIDYTVQDTDRHGNPRLYVRYKGKKKRLKVWPDQEGFQEAYTAALAELGRAREPEPKPARTEGTLAWLIEQYWRSSDFYQLEPSTRASKISILGRIAKDSGVALYADIQRPDILAGRDRRKETPATANKFLKEMRVLFDWAIDRGLHDHNPVLNVKRLKIKSDGFRTWTEADREAFTDCWPIGSKPRLAYELGMIGLRKSDMVVAGTQHFTKDWRIIIEQKKTGERLAKSIPQSLIDAIEQTPRSGLHLLENQYGDAYSAKGFGAAMKRWCRKAGTHPECSSHGLRKAHGAILGERGASELEIAASLGQRGTSSVKHYTIGADREQLADRATERLKNESVPPGETVQVKSVPLERKT